jgi:uncharacterized protein (TIGR02453 family)
MAVTSRPGFAGFDRALLDFLAGLAAHNEKAWFEAHRADYERLYARPAQAFSEALLPKLAALGTAAPREGGLMRIYRDTRFSKDKTPYKTALHLRFAAGKLSPALMLRITPDELGLAAGCFGFDASQLVGYRRAVGDAKAARSLRAAIARAEKAGHSLPAPQLARVPRGFEPTSASADLLRYKGLWLGGDRPLPRELFGPESVAYCTARFRELWPVYDWLAARVG